MLIGFCSPTWNPVLRDFALTWLRGLRAVKHGKTSRLHDRLPVLSWRAQKGRLRIWRFFFVASGEAGFAALALPKTAGLQLVALYLVETSLPTGDKIDRDA